MMLFSIKSLLILNQNQFGNPIIYENPCDFISSLTFFFLFYEFRFLGSCYVFSSLTFFLCKLYVFAMSLVLICL